MRDAKGAGTKAASAPPVKDLKGRKIGLCWTAFTNGDVLLRHFRDHLAARYPDAQFVEIMPGRGLRGGDHPEPNIGELAREHGIDAAIITAGC